MVFRFALPIVSYAQQAEENHTLAQEVSLQQFHSHAYREGYPQ